MNNNENIIDLLDDVIDFYKKQNGTNAQLDNIQQSLKNFKKLEGFAKYNETYCNNVNALNSGNSEKIDKATQKTFDAYDETIAMFDPNVLQKYNNITQNEKVNFLNYLTYSLATYFVLEQYMDEFMDRAKQQLGATNNGNR